VYVTGILKSAAFAAAVAAMLLLSACSSDSGNDDTATEPTAAADEATQPAAEETPAADVEATTEPTAAPEQTPEPELTPGPSVIDTTNADQAMQWQQSLASLGYDVTVDGDFGPGTEEATRKFQETMDLPVSGVVDQATWDVANFLLIAQGDAAAAPPDAAPGSENEVAAAEGEAPPPPEAEPTPLPLTAEERDARFAEASTSCVEQHGQVQAGPCVSESMCFDTEPVSAATECRNTYWNLWQLEEPGI
jgi:peptidoglycan hydrolase-like protein with peptidoglycan-binding domain